MNVASLEPCEELYELSGWDDTYLRWTNFKPATVVNADEWANHEERLHHLELVGDDVLEEASDAPYPAYDLGYLMRKLPDCAILNSGGGKWACVYTNKALGKADTPEDAAAKLAIELFKQGVLVKPEKEG